MAKVEYVSIEKILNSKTKALAYAFSEKTRGIITEHFPFVSLPETPGSDGSVKMTKDNGKCIITLFPGEKFKSLYL